MIGFFLFVFLPSMNIYRKILFLLILSLLWSCKNQNDSDMHTYTNDLIHETSPYLLQHAH
ncbi:MAG: hypothetical protein ACI9Y7_002855, partial [Dokdonia sp.]